MEDRTTSNSVEYWKTRALKAEQDFHQLQQELRKERKERKEYENLLIQRFDQFCSAYEEKVMNEVMKYQSNSLNSINIENGFDGDRDRRGISGKGSHSLLLPSGRGLNESSPSSTSVQTTIMSGENVIKQRSNTPRRAAPIPPSKRSSQS